MLLMASTIQTVSGDAAQKRSRHRIALAVRLENILDVFDKVVSNFLANTARPNIKTSEATLPCQWENLQQLDEVLFIFRQWVNDISTRTGTGTQKGIRKVSCYDVLQTLEDAQGVILGDKQLISILPEVLQNLHEIFDVLEIELRNIHQEPSSVSYAPCDQFPDQTGTRSCASYVTIHGQVMRLFSLSNTISDLYFALVGSVEDLQQDRAVLSLDGGGVKSYSSLLILRALMEEIRILVAQGNVDMIGFDTLRPCNFFDLIVGSSSGGLIAIMLGRLRMTVEESLGVFEEFGEEVFGHSRFLDRILQPFTYKYSSERLRNGIEKVVQKHGRAEGDREWKRDMFPANENKCKTAVVVRKVSEKTSNIEVFRTYDTAYQPATNVPTHLIALATASSPLYFPPVLINDNRYQDPAVSGFNNPSFIALKEARQEFELSEKNTGAFVSVGSGHRDPDYSSFGSISVGTSFVWHLGALASNTRRLITRVDHQDLLMRFAKHPNYYRFSSTHLIGSLPLDDWRGRRGSKTLDYITYLTSAYLGTDEVRDALKKCAKRLVERRREEKALVPDHTSALSNDHDRGIMYREQGKLDYAEQMFKQALAGQEEVLGSDHISTLRTANNLGDLYREQDQLDKAEQMYRKVLSGREKVLGLDHTSTLDTVNNLGNLYRDQGRLDEAEQMYMRAIAGQAKALGPDHTLTLRAVNNLGDLYREQGQLDKAEKMYVQALAGQETTLGPDHILTLRTVNNLGVLYYEQGKLDETEQMYLRVLAGYEKVLGFDHMSTLRIINNIGVIYHDQGKLDEAAQMYQRALAGYEKVLGPYHETHASSLAIVNNLGNLYKNQGKLKKAEEMYQRALEGSEKALGPHHTSTLNAVNNLGNLYKNQGRLNEAEELYQRVPAWQGEGSRAGSQQDAATKRRLMG